MPISEFPTMIEVTSDRVMISFVRLGGMRSCGFAKSSQVKVSCAELGTYHVSIGELVEKVDIDRLRQFEWKVEPGLTAIAVNKETFMMILPLDDWRKNGFCGMCHTFGDIVNDISNDIIGRPIAIYPAVLCSTWGESFNIELDNYEGRAKVFLSIEPDAEVEVRCREHGRNFIATIKDLLGVRPRADLIRYNPHAIADGVAVVEYTGNSMKMKRFIVNLDAVDYVGVQNERKKRLNSMYGTANATVSVYGFGEFYITYQTPYGLRSCIYERNDEVEIIERGNHRCEAVTVTFVDLLNGIPATYADYVYTKITDAEVKYCIADMKVLCNSVYLSSDIFNQVVAAAKRRKEAEGYYIDTDCVHERLTFGPGKIYAGTPGAFGDLIGIVPEAIRRAIIENEEEKKMDNQFSMAIRSIRSYSVRRYPQRSSNDETVVPKIKKVYFNKPVTVVLWEDGTKTVVKCQPGERYDAEKGLAMAISKKALGNTSKWYDALKKELENAPKPKKRSSAKKKEDSNDEKA